MMITDKSETEWVRAR